MLEFCFLTKDEDLTKKDREYITQFCPRWYTLMAILDGLKKKKEKYTFQTYIIIDEGYKVWNVRVKFEVISCYFERKMPISRVDSENKNIEILTQLATEILVDLTTLTSNEYTDKIVSKTFMYKDYCVTGYTAFNKLFKEYYFSSPRLEKKVWLGGDKTRLKRSQSSPPEMSSSVSNRVNKLQAITNGRGSAENELNTNPITSNPRKISIGSKLSLPSPNRKNRAKYIKVTTPIKIPDHKKEELKKSLPGIEWSSYESTSPVEQIYS